MNSLKFCAAFLANFFLVSAKAPTILETISADCQSTPFAFHIRLPYVQQVDLMRSMDGKCSKEFSDGIEQHTDTLSHTFKVVRNFYAQPEPANQEFLRFRAYVGGNVAGLCAKGFEELFLYFSMDKVGARVEDAPCLKFFHGGAFKMVMTGDEFQIHILDPTCSKSIQIDKATRSNPGLCVAINYKQSYQFDIVKGSDVVYPPGELSPYAWNTEDGVRDPPASGQSNISGGQAGAGSGSGGNGQTGGSVATGGSTQTPSSGSAADESSLLKKIDQAKSTTSGANAFFPVGLLSLLTLTLL